MTYQRHGSTCSFCAGFIPDEASHCPECGRSPASYLPPARTDRRWLILGGGFLAVAAIAAGVLVAFVLGGDDGRNTAGTDGSATPTPSASVAASPSGEPAASEPASSTSASPTVSPGVARLANLSIAEVTVPALNLRAGPGQGFDVRGELPTGARVFVIGAPEESEDATWYRVGVASHPLGECVPPAACQFTVGWVAEGGTPDDPWLPPVDVACPNSPMTADQLAGLASLERLHCYGDGELTVTGTINHPFTGIVGPIRYEPAWLAAPVTSFLFNGTNMWLRFEADEIPQELMAGHVIRATLAMEHDDAPTCRQFVDPAFLEGLPPGETPPAIQLPDPASTVLICRTELVVRDFEIIGSEEIPNQ